MTPTTMSTSSTPVVAATPVSTAPPLAAARPQAGRARPPRKDTELGAGHLRRRILVGTAVLVVAWLAFMVWVPFHAWGNVHRIDASPEGARPAPSKGYDYVLVGSDSRQGLTPEQQKQLNTGSTKVAGQTHRLDHPGPRPVR